MASGLDLAAIQATFAKFDSDNNGSISYEELEAVLGGVGGFASPQDLRKIIESVSSFSRALIGWCVSRD